MPTKAPAQSTAPVTRPYKGTELFGAGVLGSSLGGKFRTSALNPIVQGPYKIHWKIQILPKSRSGGAASFKHAPKGEDPDSNPWPGHESKWCGFYFIFPVFQEL